MNFGYRKSASLIIFELVKGDILKVNEPADDEVLAILTSYNPLSDMHR